MNGDTGKEEIDSEKASKPSEVLGTVLAFSFLGALVGALVSIFGPAFGSAVLWGVGIGSVLGVVAALSPEPNTTAAKSYETRKQKKQRELWELQDEDIRNLSTTDPFVSQMEEFIAAVEAPYGRWLANEAPHVLRTVLNDIPGDYHAKVRIFLRVDSATRLLGLLIADGSVEPHVGTYINLSRIYLGTDFIDGQSLLEDASEPPSWLVAMANTSGGQSDWTHEIARMSDIYVRYTRKVAHDAGSAAASNAAANAINSLNQELTNAGILRSHRQSKSNPKARLIRTPEDAEAVAAEFMQYLGHADAQARPKGPDSGVDVESGSAVAQVKAQAGAVGRPAVQNLYGVARSLEKEGFFFSLGGYTREALDWGTQHGICMFSFDLQGTPTPANMLAQEKDP